MGLACRPSPALAARPSFTRQRREPSRWGRKNASNRLENWPEGLLRPATRPSLGILPFILKRMPKPTEKQIHCLSLRESTCTGQKRTDRRWSGWTSRRPRCFTLRTATAYYDRVWVARNSGKNLLWQERLYFFLVIVQGENCQVTPALTHAVLRSDVIVQGQFSRIVRIGTLGAVSSSLPAPSVKKVRVRGIWQKKSMSG